MTFANGLLVSLLLFGFYAGAENNLAKAQTGVLIEGRVVYPDGTAAGGARVVAESSCTDTTVHLVEETTANPDGRFSIKSFDPTCNKYAFSASHREAFWLPTDNDIFYIEPNGTTPALELKSGQIPEPVLIRLAQRGGEVELRVFDEKTRSYIYAGVDIHREPVGHRTFGGSVYTSTGDDGSSHTLFLPPGSYIVKVNRYMCHGKTYFSSKSPTLTFSVKAGARQTETLKVNVAEIQADASYDNPKAMRCFQ